MANSQLQHKTFPVPELVLRELGKNLKIFSDKRNSKGFNRAIFILERRTCSYEQLKRIKNYFDYTNVNDPNFNEVEYLLNGGDMMKEWVNSTLQRARQDVSIDKAVTSDAGMTDQYRNTSMKPKVPIVRGIPAFMTSQELREELNKIKEMNKKLI